MTAAQQLISIGRELSALGISPGSSGNISVREGERLLVTGTGVQLGDLREDDLAVLDLDGTHLAGARASKEVPLHRGMYRRDPEFGAVVHLHSPWATALSCTPPWSERSAVPPLTPYFVMRVGQTPLLPYRMPGSPQLGEDVLAAPGPFRAALLAHHGSVVAGRDLREALDRAVELEEACRLAVLTASVPRRVLDPAQIAELAERWGSPWTSESVRPGQD
ncbi:class II aldolase/adducin family protein [Brachybacterium hainanense]|uniref:Class II aldolase/adducin family protein n=1 Tax=Brachybacterium hainanense TaxID=1541174 RepID=A0ABV6R899_9MICO